ncbi:hypothetical protein HanPI659440_Chr12g0443471 [Helianthus annuus]|nr:hypothetical protein HanPI659440_Chr12g0443471 [Helianthus annuus]
MSGSIKNTGATKHPPPNPSSCKMSKLKVQINPKSKSKHELVISTEKGVTSLTLDKLDGGLGMKRVKRSKYEKESVIWMRGK